MTRQPNGHFTVVLAQPLEGGQQIYVRDTCFNPTLIGPPILVLAPAPAPTLSHAALALLAAVLATIFGLALVRLRRGVRG